MINQNRVVMLRSRPWLGKPWTLKLCIKTSWWMPPRLSYVDSPETLKLAKTAHPSLKRCTSQFLGTQTKPHPGVWGKFMAKVALRSLKNVMGNTEQSGLS